MPWVKAPVLTGGERLVHEILGNRWQSRWRATGGKLFLTDRRVVFNPHALEMRLLGRPWEAPLERVRAVGIEPRSLSWSGLRRRLKLRLDDGTDELFTVNRPEAVMHDMRRLIGLPD
jgi:hypothetical protein